MKEESRIKEVRTRRPNARHKDIVFGALAERLDVLKGLANDGETRIHAERIEELLDELRRSISKPGEAANE